jgi:hypothetical protein
MLVAGNATTVNMIALVSCTHLHAHARTHIHTRIYYIYMYAYLGTHVHAHILYGQHSTMFAQYAQ